MLFSGLTIWSRVAYGEKAGNQFKYEKSNDASVSLVLDML
jgi:hypothetical protein